jgi:hypothetical protein
VLQAILLIYHAELIMPAGMQYPDEFQQAAEGIRDADERIQGSLARTLPAEKLRQALKCGSRIMRMQPVRLCERMGGLRCRQACAYSGCQMQRGAPAMARQPRR